MQEAGVDEPDVVKTDGTTLFRVEHGDLVTYDLTGAEVERLASLDLPGVDRLRQHRDPAVRRHRGGALAPWLPTGAAAGAVTELATVDVSDPAAPEVTHTVEYDTALVTARLHDGVVRLVLQAGLPDLDFAEPDQHTTEYEATRENRDAVRDHRSRTGCRRASRRRRPAEQPLLDCDQVAIPDDGTSLGTIAVVGFDASAPEAPSVSGLAVDTDLAYASADQLYLATSPTYGGVIGGCFDCMEPSRCRSARLLPGWLPGGADGVDCCSPIPAPRGGYDDASHLYAFDLDGIDTTFAASGRGGRRDPRPLVDGRRRRRAPRRGRPQRQHRQLQLDRHLPPGGQRPGRVRPARRPRRRRGDRVGPLVRHPRHRRHLPPGRPALRHRPHRPRPPAADGRAQDPGLLGVPPPARPAPPARSRAGSEGGNGRWGAQAGLFNVTDLTNPHQLDVVEFGPDTQALATQDPRQLTWLPDGRTVLTVVADYGKRGNVGYVSVLTLGEGELSNRMVQVEYGDEVAAVRLVPLADGRVVLVTGDDATFFDL